MFIPHTRLLSVNVCTLPKKDIKNKLYYALRSGHGVSIFTPNTQMLLSANKDGRLCKLLNSADNTAGGKRYMAIANIESVGVVYELVHII